MPKKTKIRPEQHDDPELDISSLIDVSFLLLIFFLVTSTLLKLENDLALKVPVDQPPSDPVVALEIAIADDGRITIGGQEMAGPSTSGEEGKIEEIRSHLKHYRERSELLDEEPLVSIDASGEANAQRFIDVLNALAYAKIENIALASN